MRAGRASPGDRSQGMIHREVIHREVTEVTRELEPREVCVHREFEEIKK